ncbi:hypothetical protein STXM2123_5084 [Streptomyces sp. F-3]|nr:hypothetical protein STXM2123_5084 [Streptomyces sp. F-3]
MQVIDAKIVDMHHPESHPHNGGSRPGDLVRCGPPSGSRARRRAGL